MGLAGTHILPLVYLTSDQNGVSFLTFVSVHADYRAKISESLILGGLQRRYYPLKPEINDIVVQLFNERSQQRQTQPNHVAVTAHQLLHKQPSSTL